MKKPIYCEFCGKKLLIGKSTEAFNPYTGKAKQKLVCPQRKNDWESCRNKIYFFSLHTYFNWPLSI